MGRRDLLRPAAGALAACAAILPAPGATQIPAEGLSRRYTVPIVDIAGDVSRQVVVDREPGQYLGHPTTVLLEDGRTIIAVYPKGHGRGAIVMKRSADGGRTWSARLPVPGNWSTSLETPTIHRVVDAKGVKRLILFSGLHPIRMSVSEDDGATWTPLAPIGGFGGIVAMASVVERRTGPGHYLAFFHDDGRFFAKGGTRSETMTLYQTASVDGGLTWSAPRVLHASARVHLCEPGVIRSPDGRQLAMLLRENRRVDNSYLMVSDDEGRSWSTPQELPAALTGDRHVGRYAPDGRLFLSFRDTTHQSPTRGDWVGWVGRYEDVVQRRQGQYRVRLMDNLKDADTAYPGVEVLPDGTFVTTTYGHWVEGEPPFVVSVRFTLRDLDRLVPSDGSVPDVSPALATAGLPAAVRRELEQAYEAVRRAPRAARAAGNLAMTLHAYEQLSAARFWYGRARAIDPASAALAYLEGVVQADLGDHAAAAVALHAAVGLDSAYLPARVRLADSLMRAGDLAASRAVYEELTREYPELAAAHYGLGHVAAASGDYRAASGHYGRAAELVPQFGAAQYALALAYRHLGEPARAEPHMEAYRRYGNHRPVLADPWLDPVRALKSTARETLVQAARAGAEGRLEESIALHLRALEQDPGVAQAHVNLISLYGRVGRVPDAERHYLAAVALGANLADAHYNYGVLLAANGREDDALAAFQRAIDVNPFLASAHSNMASLLVRRGRVSEAAASYRQAIASDPRHRGARAGMSQLLAAEGRYREAIDHLLRCLEPDDADTPRYALALSRAYGRAGDVASAREWGERAVRGAASHGDRELAAAIRRELDAMPR